MEWEIGALGPAPSRGLPTVAPAFVGKRERRLARPAGLEPAASDLEELGGFHGDIAFDMMCLHEESANRNAFTPSNSLKETAYGSLYPASHR